VLYYLWIVRPVDSSLSQRNPVFVSRPLSRSSSVPPESPPPTNFEVRYFASFTGPVPSRDQDVEFLTLSAGYEVTLGRELSPSSSSFFLVSLWRGVYRYPRLSDSFWRPAHPLPIITPSTCSQRYGYFGSSTCVLSCRPASPLFSFPVSGRYLSLWYVAWQRGSHFFFFGRTFR